MFTIIEDASPYFIRCTHPGMDEIIDLCKTELNKVIIKHSFMNHKLDWDLAGQILALVPVDIKLQQKRTSLFVTQPGRYYRPHKDGFDHRFSINYTVQVLDDKCVTSWYSDMDLDQYAKTGAEFPGYGSREIDNYDGTKKPLKSMVAVQGECILFNTDIYHDFDNSDSTNQRAVLTLRAEDSGNVYFDDMKRMMFGL
jgi:hypothetical protein